MKMKLLVRHDDAQRQVIYETTEATLDEAFEVLRTFMRDSKLEKVPARISCEGYIQWFAERGWQVELSAAEV